MQRSNGGEDCGLLDGWWTEFLGGVASDNGNQLRPARHSETWRMLRQAPQVVSDDALLTMHDFEDNAEGTLEKFRSDQVATRFSPETNGSLNLLVARMTVPGGLRPGTYGIEGVLFTARATEMPDWFPPLAERPPLVFAQLVAGTPSYSTGQATVVFPEFISVRERDETQAFGIVFEDKLHRYLSTQVVPLAADLGLIDPSERASLLEQSQVRSLGFLAHEWGHATTPTSYNQTVVSRRRRIPAVISELYADFAALTMLYAKSTQEARLAALTIVLDRLLRTAWLPNSDSQVDSIAARTFLSSLCDRGAIEPAGEKLRLDEGALIDSALSGMDQVEELDAEYFAGNETRVESALAHMANVGMTFPAFEMIQNAGSARP